ncbi:hypothetical protein BDQ17DRAFT_1330500 [Cyathus striatus]|nr:hypothetical protein BDQ17DRAFT_1330500 [Cyathus striatus]
MPETRGIAVTNLSNKDILPIYIYGTFKVQRGYERRYPTRKRRDRRFSSRLLTEKFPLKAIGLPPIHLQPGSFHVPYKVYERITLLGPQGVEGIYIPWGSSIVLENPWRRIVLTKDTLDTIDGVDSPLFTFYANVPDEIYVPDSACIKQEKVPVQDMVKIKKAKTVTVTPQNFLFEGTPVQERRQALTRVPKGELSSDLDVEDMRAVKRRLSVGGSDGMNDL